MGESHPPNNEHIDGDMYKLEVNLDDMSGELVGYMMDLLIESGANDVYYTPIYMKKNRPGILLQLLCSEVDLDKMKTILFKETTTLGLRYYPLTVHRAKRTFETLETKWGPITVKKGIHEGELIQQSPEYNDCVAIAQQNDIPLKKVYEHIWSILTKHDEKNNT